MRILYVTDALAIWGGMERVLVEKANYLAAHYGYEVYMLTVCQGGHPFPFPLDSSVHYVDMDIPFHIQYQYPFIRRMLMLRRLHRRSRTAIRNQLETISPDVIVCARIELVRDICWVKEVHRWCLSRMPPSGPVVLRGPDCCDKFIPFG